MIAAIHALVFSLLFALPVLAAAECAWVLWQNSVTIVSINPTKLSYGDWKTDDSFQTLEACRTSRDAFRQAYPPPAVERAGAYYSEYTCLPDTVDPRGPKVK